MARGVLVEQRVVEDRAERADPAPRRRRARPRRAATPPSSFASPRAKVLAALVGVDRDRAAALEADAEARGPRLPSAKTSGFVDGDDAVGALGIRAREDLLGREVREVLDAVDRLEERVRPVRGRQQADRQVGARPLEVQRVEAALVQAPRRHLRWPRSARARPRPGSSSSRRQTCAISSQSSSSAASSSSSGWTWLAQPAVGNGTMHQFVVRSPTTLPLSFTRGSRSRPARVGSSVVEEARVDDAGRQDARAVRSPSSRIRSPYQDGTNVERVRRRRARCARA